MTALDVKVSVPLFCHGVGVLVVYVALAFSCKQHAPSNAQNNRWRGRGLFQQSSIVLARKASSSMKRSPLKVWTIRSCSRSGVFENTNPNCSATGRGHTIIRALVPQKQKAADLESDDTNHMSWHDPPLRQRPIQLQLK